MAIVFCVVGADPRQNAAAAALRAAGCTVLPPDRAAEAPNLLLPMTTAESQPESMAAEKRNAAKKSKVVKVLSRFMSVINLLRIYHTSNSQERKAEIRTFVLISFL